MLTLELSLDQDYCPGELELRNLCGLIMRVVAGWPVRGADFEVCKMLAGPVLGPLGIDRFVWVVCEYTYDHILGEPSDISPQIFFEQLREPIQEWYRCTSPEDRSH